MVDTPALVFSGDITPATNYGYIPIGTPMRGWWRLGVDASTAVRNYVPGMSDLTLIGSGTPSYSAAYQTLRSDSDNTGSYYQTGYTDAPNCSGGILVRGDTGLDVSTQPTFMGNYDGSVGTSPGPGIFLWQNAANRVSLRVYYETAVSSLYYTSLTMTVNTAEIMALFWWVENDPSTGEVGLIDMISGASSTISETRTRVAHTQTFQIGNKPTAANAGACQVSAAYLSHETGSAQLRAAQWAQMRADAIARGLSIA